MGRYTGPRNKIARRFGVNLGLKTNPTKVGRRLSQKPGVHGPNGRRPTKSSFSRQLIEKQKAKYVYGLRERQLAKLVEAATAQAGNSEVHLNELFERRLDNTVYRLGFGITRAQARQFVGHGMFLVNGRPLNVPSYTVKVGDIISIKENKRRKGAFTGKEEQLKGKELPSWLSLDSGKLEGKVIGMPQVADFEKVFDAKLIIEYYATR